MLINLSELFTREGKEETYQVPFEADTVDHMGQTYEVTEKQPVQITVTNLGERKLLLEGHAELTLSISCSRCLTPVPYPVSIDVDTVLDLKLTEDERARELDEQPFLNGYNLDVDQLVCNELLLSLPMKVLCREDCKGICNRCGANLNIETCDCDTRALDPRMSVIQDIFNQYKEV